MVVEDHEMYPNAPIALVTVEITFPGEIGAPVPAGVQPLGGAIRPAPHNRLALPERQSSASPTGNAARPSP